MTLTARTGEEAIEYFPRTKPWRVIGDRLRLIGMKCEHCGLKAFPAREVCSGCGSDKIGEVELSDTGTIYTFSEVHVAPKGFAVPYAIGYVDLDDGVRLLGQFDDAARELSIGQKVAVVPGVIRTRGDGSAIHSYKFRGQPA